MKLNKDQQQALTEKLAEVWPGSKNCSICSRDVWDIADCFFELRGFQGGNIIIGDGVPTTPLIQITCRNCGHTIMFNAFKLGLMKKVDGTFEIPEK